MPMRSVTLRFSEGVWDTVQREAQIAGISASQFVREAVLARAAFEIGRREEGRDWERVFAEVRRMLGPEES